MQEENREGISGALKTLAAVVIVFLLLAALYVGYQAMQVLFPPNTYETALLATVEDTVAVSYTHLTLPTNSLV